MHHETDSRVITVCPFAAASSEEAPNIEIAGLTITRGMPEDAVRFEIVYPYTIYCAEKAEGVDDDIEYCSIFSEEEPINVGEVWFQDGRVLSANRFVSVPEDAYHALHVLYELLAQLTDGKSTCALVRTGGRPPGFIVALPEKKVSVMLHTAGDKTSIALRVGLRRNPTPELQIKDCWPQAGADEDQD